jgi:hypothetical protein
MITFIQRLNIKVIFLIKFIFIEFNYNKFIIKFYIHLNF